MRKSRSDLHSLFALKVAQVVLALICFLVLSPADLLARYSLRPDVVLGSGVRVKLYSVYDYTPVRGFLPLVLRVQNESGRTREWVLRSSSKGTHRRSEIVWERSFRVRDGEDRVFRMFAPIAPISGNSSNVTRMHISLSGYGVKPRTFTSQTPTYSYAVTPFVLMSEELAQRYWGTLEVHFRDARKGLNGSKLTPADFPDDWRGYTGVESIWLACRDWEIFNSAQRNAVKAWVFQGGALHFECERFPLLFQQGTLFREPGSSRYGSGYVDLFERYEEDQQFIDFFDVSLHSEASPERTILSSKAWTLSPELLESSVPVGFLLLLMCAYAFVVGPLNLLFFAHREKRYRLFVTTPVVALLATVFICLVIFFKDGLGGTGSRFALLLFQPQSHQVHVIQEQVARTGLLLSGEFPTGEDLFFTVVPGVSPVNDSRSFSASEGVFAGDWFQNRALQLHIVETVRPTRAGFELLSPVEGFGYRFKSNLKSPVDTLFYIDRRGLIWRADGIGAGKSFHLAKSSPADLRIWAQGVLGRAGEQIRFRLRVLMQRRGVFIASSERGKEHFIPTLKSIAWKNDLVVLAGEVPEVGA